MEKGKTRRREKTSRVGERMGHELKWGKEGRRGRNKERVFRKEVKRIKDEGK